MAETHDQNNTSPAAGNTFSYPSAPGRAVPSDGGIISGPPPRRPTSASYDLSPAQKSLVDALKVSFRILQIALFVLVAVYFLTGGRIVQEQEAGLRLVFGRIIDEEPLSPGLHASWPYPIGEFIRINTAPQSMELEEEFWITLSDDEQNTPYDRLNRPLSRGLDPENDGSIITSDANLAHTRWRVIWSISNPRQFQEQIAGEAADDLVRLAVERGVVRAAATVDLDAVISSPGELARRAQGHAQRVLDQIDAGLRIQSLSAIETRPPVPVYASFEEVTQAQAEARNEVERAQRSASRLLNDTAGAVHRELTNLIGQYESVLLELLIDPSVQPQADAVLSEIEDLLAAAGGNVTGIILRAERDRTQLVSAALTEWETFNATWARYQEAPS
ncbi:MAG: SPFH domain-containing protein, partial [Planctomycetota bacterium]